MLLIPPVDQESSPKVFFSVAEASGARHAGGGIRCLRSEEPGVVCVGLGGPDMTQAGCNLLENTVLGERVLLYYYHLAE